MEEDDFLRRSRITGAGQEHDDANIFELQSISIIITIINKIYFRITLPF